MSQSSIINLVLMFIYVVACFGEGWIDGYRTRTGKLLHGYKLESHGGLLVMWFISIMFSEWQPSMYLPFVAVLLVRKPIIDYSYGMASKALVIPTIGTTSLTDRIINWTGIQPWGKKHKIPALEMIYFAMLGFGVIILPIELGTDTTVYNFFWGGDFWRQLVSSF